MKQLMYAADGSVVEAVVEIDEAGTETTTVPAGPMRTVAVKLPWAQYRDVLRIGARLGLDTSATIRTLMAFGGSAAREHAGDSVARLTDPDEIAGAEQRIAEVEALPEPEGGLRYLRMVERSGEGAVTE
jgi:hypothetical protein